MASFPPLGDYQNGDFILTGIDVEGINAGDIPTDQNIASEAHRRRRLEDYREVIPPADIAQSELRYHAILSMRTNAAGAGPLHPDGIKEGDNGMPPLHPQFTLMLQNIQAAQQNIQLSLNALSRKLDASIQICSARSINKTIIHCRNYDQNFEVLPKQYPNHPWANPPRQLKGFKVRIDGDDDDDMELQEFQIDGDGYEVGDNPPVGLIPANLNELNMIRGLELADFQSRLRGIYWFYNDPKLSIPADASLSMCHQGLYNLKRFLKH